MREGVSTGLDGDILEQTELIPDLDTSQDPQYLLDEDESYGEPFLIQQDLNRYRQIQLTETSTYASD